ncbi:MAG: alpha/beta hydrolase [Bacteriovorax sp.]
MKEKSEWFYTEYKSDTKAVVLLAHGLNLDPKKMDELASFFNSKKCDVLRIALPENPSLWTDQFGDDYEAALEHAEILQRPLYFVGYSLGALVGMYYMATHPNHQFNKLALFAPASHTRLYARIPALLSFIFPRASLPSLNLVGYRKRNKTTLAEYQKMIQLQHEIKSNDFNLPTLLIVSSRDELIASGKLSKFAALNPLWKTLQVSNRESQISKKYHHLMITEESLGHSMWQKILKNLTEHFSL